MSEEQRQERARVLAKIKKLLTLAHDGRGNPHEAAAALRQAQALMNKHQVEEKEAILAELRNDEDAIVSVYAKSGFGVADERTAVRRFPEHLGWLATAIADLNDCKAFVRVDAMGRVRLSFAGYNLDIKVTEWMFSYLLDCIKRSHRDLERALKAQDGAALAVLGVSEQEARKLLTGTPRARGDAFRESMCLALVYRIKDLGRERHTTGNALVVIKKDKIAEKLKIKEQPRKAVVKYNALGNAVLGAAKSAANKVNLSPNPIEHTSKSAGALTP